MAPLIEKTTFGDEGGDQFAGTEADIDSGRVQLGRGDTEGGPILHSRMGESGGIIQDVSGNAHHFTNVGAPTHQPGLGIRGGDRVDLDGIDDALQQAGIAELEVLTAITLEAWIKAPDNLLPGDVAPFVVLADSILNALGNLFTGKTTGVDPVFFYGADLTVIGDDGGGGIETDVVPGINDDRSFNPFIYVAVRIEAPQTPQAIPRFIVNINARQVGYLQTPAVAALGEATFTKSATLIALGVVTFTVDGAATGIVTVPIGTIVETVGAIQFQTTTIAEIDTASETTGDAAVEALVGGDTGNVLAGTIVQFPGPPPTDIIAVTNGLPTATPNVPVPQGSKIQTAGGVEFITTAPGTINTVTENDVTLPIQAVLPGTSGNVLASTIVLFVIPIPDVASVDNANPTAGGGDLGDAGFARDTLGNPMFLDSSFFPTPTLEVGRSVAVVPTTFFEGQIAGIRVFNRFLEDQELDLLVNGSYSYNKDFGFAVLATHINVTATVGSGQAINMFIDVSDDAFATIKDTKIYTLKTGTFDYALDMDGRYWKITFRFSTEDPTETPTLSDFTLEGFGQYTTLATKGLRQNLPHIYGLREKDYLNQLLWRWASELGVSIEQADIAVAMIIMVTAGGKWLDRHGDWFNIPRITDELDDPYQERIIEETIRPRANNLALENIAELNGFTIQVIDLWARADILGGIINVTSEALVESPGGTGQYIGSGTGGVLVRNNVTPGSFKATSITGKVITDGLVDDEALSHLGAAVFEGSVSGAVGYTPVRVEELLIDFTPSGNQATVGIDGVITGDVNPGGTNTLDFETGQINVTSSSGTDTGATMTYTRVPDGTLIRDIDVAFTNRITYGNGLPALKFVDGAASTSATADYQDFGNGTRKGLFGIILSVQKVYSEIPLADRIRMYFLLEKHKTGGTYMVFLAPAAFLITTDLLADPSNISVVNETLAGQRFAVGPVGGAFTIVSIADFIGLGLKYRETPFVIDGDSWAYFLFAGNMTDQEGNLLNGALGADAGFVASPFDQALNHSAATGNTTLALTNEITHPAAFTVDVLLRPVSYKANPNEGDEIIFLLRDGTNDPYWLTIRRDTGELAIRLNWYDGAINRFIDATALGTDLDLQFWVRAVFDDAHPTDKVKLLVDGVLIGTDSNALQRDATSTLEVVAGPTDGFLGTIEELMISNVAR